MGICHLKMSLIFVYLFEIIPEDWKVFSCTIMSASEQLVLVVFCIYFNFVERNIRSVSYFFLLMHLIVIILTAILIPESPIWLASRQKYKKTREVVNKIARLNGCDFQFDSNTKIYAPIPK